MKDDIRARVYEAKENALRVDAFDEVLKILDRGMI